jgi:HSP20 family protein
MDTLFHRFGAAAGGAGEWQGVFPAVNLYETADSYTLTAELPGVEPDAIEVSVQGSTVTLSGERKIEFGTDEETSLHRSERQAGRFRRAFQLPAAIDADKIEAVHRNGVLMLRLPKTPEHQPRQIAVRAS